MKINDNRQGPIDFYFVSAGEIFEFHNKFFIRTNDEYNCAVCLKNGKLEHIGENEKVNLVKATLTIS